MEFIEDVVANWFGRISGGPKLSSTVHEPIVEMAIRVLLLALPALAQACLGFRWVR